MSFDYKNIYHWLYGLSAAFIGGAATSITVMIIDPSKFNLKDQWENVAEAAFIAGVINAAFYLKSSPLPTNSDANSIYEKPNPNPPLPPAPPSNGV